MQKNTLLLFLIFFYLKSFSQDEYTIHFQDKSIQLLENIDSFQWDQLNTDTKIQNGFYVWLQFYQTPSKNIHDVLKSKNIQLLEYIENRTYLAYIPDTVSPSFLTEQGVRSISSVLGESKLSPDLISGTIGDWAVVGDKILVTLQFHDLVTVDYVISNLSNMQIDVLKEWKDAKNIDLKIPNNCLDELTALPYIKWVEVIHAPSIKDDHLGRSLHRASSIDTQTSAGRNYTGEGIGVLVRDDGIVGPHIDFQDRIDNSFVSGISGAHGDAVAGIIAGTGNLNPKNRGMAAGATIYVVDYVPSHLDTATTSLINNGTVQITNSSYSNGCNTGYTTITETVDQQMTDLPNVLHVYSAGNSNHINCNYGAGAQWGNITGGHKQGKNVITVANVYADGSLVSTSSRGPAYDGRIKPDISAYGEGQISTAQNNTYQSFIGTSAAAPGIAGISAQLYQAYANLNNGSLPNAALIKATLLNTTNDAGNIGPDFKFGWGIVNGLRAAQLLEDERYLSDTIEQGVSNTHNINIPDGTTQVRFMLYWNDISASPGASTALVNDLDLKVSTPDGSYLLPWILDPTPNHSTLENPATTGEDHLNNMEQVLINTPIPGNYTVDISGFNLPFGAQEYFITYEIISDPLTVTYPNNSESLVPGAQEVIHWDAINTTEDFVIEYSNNSGNSWHTIGTVANSSNFHLWTVPEDVTGNALIRVTSGAFSDISDSHFSIANLVTGVTITQVCPEETTFEWDVLTGAENYDLYVLNGPYMEIIGSTSETSITAPINLENDIWYAVAASNNTEGWKNTRTNAILHSDQLFNCVLTNDLSVSTINSTSNNFSNACSDPDGIVSVTILNNGILPQTGFEISYQLNEEDIVTETFQGTLAPGETADYDFNTLLTIHDTGNHKLTVATWLANDEFLLNDDFSINMIIQSDIQTTPYVQNFENELFPALGWSIENPDENYTWEKITHVNGIDGLPTTVAFVDNYAYDANGLEDVLTTLAFDLTVDNHIVKFDLAKAQYSSIKSDGLRIEISTDCGDSFTTIYEKEGFELYTIPPPVTAKWFPTSENDWRTEEINLEAYQGSTAIFRIINIGGHGNSTFIDNFRVDNFLLAIEDNSLLESEKIALFPNPATSEVTIKVLNTDPNLIEIQTMNSQGQLIDSMKSSSNAEELRMNISDYASGIYFVAIKSGTTKTIKKLVVL